MKTLIRSLNITLILLVVFSLSSCETNSGTSKGTAKFSVSAIEEDSQAKYGGGSDTALISYHVMVSVEDSDGNPVLTDELIPVYIFGAGFVSEEVELEEGDYNLTSFMVINPAGEVIYASPLEGSPLAYLVDDPLPISFSIIGGTSVVISPEVLPVEGQTPGDFGYVSFGIQIIKPLTFHAICILDNPMIMAPIQITTADLTVIANNWHYKFHLEARVNQVIIRGGTPVYTFILEKEGYMPQRLYFSERELMATTKDNPLVLRIPWDSNQWKVLVLQPGPEDGKDAMISNLQPDKNFGDHIYFEATYISEPVLTVMRSNRSLIWFNLNALPKSATIRKAVLRLSYDIPVPWDTTIIISENTGTPDCCGAVLQKIVEPWEEYKVTWSNQPKTTEKNQVFIYPFIRNVNFIDVDVTSLYKPDPTTDVPGYGIFFKQWPEEWFPGFRFASGDYHVATMRPRLTIYYTIPVTGIK